MTANDYDHERKERKNDGEIQYIIMPKPMPSYQALMYSYLQERDLDYELAMANGWYATVSRGPRIVIPCINSARFNYWQARAMQDHPIRYDSPPIARKDSIVFLWPKVRKPAGVVIITEGPMDALAGAEFAPAIALMGGCPSQEVLDFVEEKTNELGLDKWVIVPDNDNLCMIETFLKHDKGLQVVMPIGKDLAGMPRWERQKLLGGSE
jgi:hypothetical protein